MLRQTQVRNTLGLQMLRYFFYQDKILEFLIVSIVGHNPLKGFSLKIPNRLDTCWSLTTLTPRNAQSVLWRGGRREYGHFLELHIFKKPSSSHYNKIQICITCNLSRVILLDKSAAMIRFLMDVKVWMYICVSINAIPTKSLLSLKFQM